jgi:hypothetical protein
MLRFFAIFAPVFMVSAATPTFNKDVLPILQRNCQTCHRPGEVGPMSFLTYKEARPWAKSIREAVMSRKMPPWFADPAHGKFSNDRRLADADVKTIAAWADAGAPEGNPKDAPKPIAFTEGWNIGKPDLILEMPQEYRVKASGTIEYQYFVVPTGFTEDKWVEVVELRPSNRAVVHHAVVFVRSPNSRWMRDVKPGEAVEGNRGERGQSQLDELFDFHVPGAVPHRLAPGQAKLIPAGSDFIFQMHYTANGNEATDRSRIGLVFAKEPPKERVFSMLLPNRSFVIPAGAANHPVDLKFTLQSDVKLVSMFPHMHLRGKAFEIRATVPGGETKTLLSVPGYRFDWQLQYYLAEQLQLPAGTRFDLSARYDNSPNNSFNPDATKEVRWGDQSWEEMMVAVLDVAIDTKMNPLDLYRPRPRPGP